MKKLILVCLTCLMLTVIVTRSQGQTCCSGGVPLANNVGGLPPADEGTLRFSLTFDGNFLRTLKDDRTTLNDRSRKRTTYSLLFRSAYTFNSRWAAELLLSGVQQSRVISREGLNDQTRTTGPGDAFALVYYQYHRRKNLSMTLGAGPKAPLGPSDLQDERGITLNADLQPGSGAWDIILHHNLSLRMTARPSAVFTHYVTYRLTGENDDYLGSLVYEFGNEFQMITGISEQQVLGNQLIGYGLNLRYRYAWQDRNNGEWLPNTGGQWVFMSPSFSWYLTRELTLTLNSEFPLFSQVQGTQLTPSVRINTGLLFSINTKKKSFNQISDPIK